MLKLIIGNKVYSSWSLRGWLAVKQSGLPFEEIVLSLYDDGWPARKMQPDLAPSLGRVPTLWDGGIPVWDSLAIIDYLDAISGGGKFWPRDKAALALARSMAAEMHAGYQPLRQSYTMNLRRVLPASQPSAEVAANIARIVQLWSEARTRFGGEGAFLFGDFGAVDIMFAPVVTRFTTYSVDVPAFAQVYMAAVTNHAFMQQWIAEAKAESWVIPQFELADPA